MISLNEYQTRRRKLAMRLPKDSIALIPAATELVRNGDAHYRFRQDSDYVYLTGFNEPEGMLLIEAGESGKSILFNQPRHPLKEQWTGKRLGQDDACVELGVDCAYSITTLEEQLPLLFANKKAIHYPVGRYPVLDELVIKTLERVKQNIRQGTHSPTMLCDLAPILSEMRLFKSEAEIQLMREAARISVMAHQRAMRACRKLSFEYEVEAEILYELTRQGCRSVAYDSIVAGGSHACVLHYTDNNQKLRKGSLVLIDAGGEFQNYAADITRTFPVSGRFSMEQKLIYELVLNAQKAGMDCIRPGCRWDKIQQAIVEVLTTGLLSLGILQGSLDDLIQTEAYKPFYMHRSGHWLGLDVHDVGSYQIDGDWRSLEPGMILTVEPDCSDELYLPNAFSPNHDGENDEFCLSRLSGQGDNNCIVELDLKIYNRWGGKDI